MKSWPSWRLVPWVIFLLVLPFREGSGSPEGLLVAHLVFLVALAASARSLACADRRLAGAAGVFLGIAALAGALGGYRYGSLLAVWDLAVVLGTLVAVEAAVRAEPAGTRLLLGAIALSGLLQAVAIAGAWAVSGLRTRGPGTLLNSDQAAAYLILAFWAAIAWTSMRGAAPRAWAPVASVIAALALGAAMLQGSRGAFLAMVAGGAVYLALRRSSMSARVQTAVVGLALGALTCAGTLIAYRFAVSHDPYRWDRLRLWSVALRVTREHLWLGVGPGVFTWMTAPFDLARADWPVRFAKHVEATHSDYLRIVAETGIAGAAAALALVALMLVRSRTAIRGRGAGDAALAAALAGLFTQAVVENLSARPAVTCTGALMAGILIARARGASLAEGTWPPAVSPGRAAAPTPPDARRGVRLLLYDGLLLWAGIVLVVAPYLGHRAFALFKEGGPRLGDRYAAAVWWSPWQPDYRAALAEAVLAGRTPRPADLAAGFGAIEEARVLKPVDSRYRLVRARLARAALASGGGSADWVRMADEDYTAAAALDPLRPQAHLERGWMHETLGDPATALQEADAALAAEPNSFEARRLRAVALVGVGRVGEARAEAAEARRRHAETAGIVPSNPYEAQVLRWDLDAWSALYARLNDDPGASSGSRNRR
jgi:O-antigen ligase